MKRVLAMFLMLVVMAVSVTGCGNKVEEECEIVLDEFEYACNSLDVDAILRCINPEVSESVRIGLALVERFTGMEQEDMIDEIAALLIKSTKDTPFDATELFHSLNVEMIRTESEGAEAYVGAKISFEALDVPVEKYAVFYMIQLEEKWYIHSFEFVDYIEE